MEKAVMKGIKQKIEYDKQKQKTGGRMNVGC